MQANNGLKLAARLFLAERPQLSPNVRQAITGQENMSNEKANGRTQRSVSQEIGFAIFGGLIFGSFIWLESYPHVSFFASWAAGTSFSAVFILSFRFFGQLRGPYLFTVAVFAGAAAGLTWWFVGHPKMHPAYAAGLGAIYAALIYLFEERSKKKRN